MSYSIVNFYKFITLPKPNEILELWKVEAHRLGLRGTILIAQEGVNCALAGSSTALSEFVAFVQSDPDFSGIIPKWSESPDVPFKRLKAKVKRWIIRFAEHHDPSVDQIIAAPRMSPQEVSQKLRERPEDFIVIDTRNDYEAEVGMFEGAVRLPIGTFTEFPEAFLSAFADQKDKTFLFYCTGGVRCEKVVPWALDRGFSNATQLDGGILKYFEDFGSEHYEGDCFVFDDRLHLDGKLQPPE